jgi:hypothetical protein
MCEKRLTTRLNCINLLFVLFLRHDWPTVRNNLRRPGHRKSKRANGEPLPKFRPAKHQSLIISRNLPEHLNVTTRRGGKTSSSPVVIFRTPLRCFLSLTQNLPNPVTKTSWPFSRVFFINSNKVSKTSTTFLRGRFSSSWMASTICAFVNVMGSRLL